MAETKTKEQQLTELIDSAEDCRKEFIDKWEILEDVYEGDYAPIGSDYEYGGRVKTHLLFDVIRKNLAILMPPGYFEFVTEPANPRQSDDCNSAETADCLTEYHFNKCSGSRKMRDILTDMLLVNRGYARVGFKEDLDDGPVEDETVSYNVSYDDGADKKKGQAFFDRIKRKDFLIARGFDSIEEAWSPGGWVARRFWPHIDWVRKNKDYAYRTGDNKIRPDSEYKGKNLDPDAPNTEVTPESDLKYVELWEMFFAPTEKKPDGRYVIFSYRQNKILYEADAMPFEGMGFPIREICFFTPRNGYYGMPLAYRSLNPLTEHEWFETQKIKALEESVDIVAADGLAPDEIETIKESGPNIHFLEGEELKENALQQVSVRIDPTPYAEGSISARARFERMWGIGTADAREQGGKIATEMVIQNKIFMAEANDLMVRVNQFIEQIARDLLTVDKQLMSPEEQARITRSIKRVWNDDDPVTLDGHYAVNIKSKPLKDMTDGEYGKLVQMYASSMVQLEQLPKYARRIDALPLIVEGAKQAGIPLAGVIKEEGAMSSQYFEISMMLMGLPIQVEPDDDHMEHLQDVQQFVQLVQQTGDQGFIDENALQAIAKHGQEHAQMLQQMQGGAAGAQGLNSVNEQRESGGQTMRSAGVTGNTQEIAQSVQGEGV